MDLRDANKARVLSNGQTYSERTRNEASEYINSEFENNPSYYIAKRYGTNEDVGVQIFGSKNPTKVEVGKTIVLRPTDALLQGQMFVLNGTTWLTVDIDNVVTTMNKGYVINTDNVLKYENETGTIMSLPCIAGDRVTIGLSEDKYMALTENKVRIKCSSLYDGDDIVEGMRFLLGRNAYIVVACNDLTPGLLDILLERDDINKNKDDVVAGVASQITQSHVVVNTEEESTNTVVTNKTLW